MPGHPARRRTTHAAAISLAAILSAVLPACSSGDDTTAGTTTTASPPAEGTTTARADTAAGALDAADTAAITAAFEGFFGGQATTVDEKVALLEDGETYRSMLEDASANEQFQQMTTTIREIRPGSSSACADLGAADGCAIVVHDLLVGGFPMAAAIESAAVRAGGSWLVAAAAWCSVVAIGGAACPGADTPETTSS